MRRNQSEKYGRMVQLIPWAYICPTVLPRNTVQNMKSRMATKKIRSHVMGSYGRNVVRYGLNTHKRTRQNCISFHTAYATNEVTEGKL